MYKKQDEVIVIDNEDDNNFPGVFIKGKSVDRFSGSGEDFFLGQEMVNSDVDRFSVSGDTHFPGQEILIQTKIVNHLTRGRH